MKQRSKLIKAKRKQNKHPVSQRLSGLAGKQEELKMEGVASEQRKHMDDSAAQQQIARSQNASKQKQNLGG